MYILLIYLVVSPFLYLYHHEIWTKVKTNRVNGRPTEQESGDSTLFFWRDRVTTISQLYSVKKKGTLYFILFTFCKSGDGLCIIHELFTVFNNTET